jgi:hypothetical protein
MTIFILIFVCAVLLALKATQPEIVAFATKEPTVPNHLRTRLAVSLLQRTKRNDGVVWQVSRLLRCKPDQVLDAVTDLETKIMITRLELAHHGLYRG